MRHNHPPVERGAAVVEMHNVPIKMASSGGGAKAGGDGSNTVAPEVRPALSSRGAPPVMPVAASGDDGTRPTHPNGYDAHDGGDAGAGSGGGGGGGGGDGDDSGDEIPVFPKEALTKVPNDFQQFDPYPGPNKVCPVTTVTVKRETNSVEDEEAFGSNGPTPRSVAYHAAKFSGLWDVHHDANMAQGQLYAPSRLPFAAAGGHYFSCSFDGRANYAVMGTPGGDMGEFIVSMCAFEKLRASPKGVTGLTHGDVKALLFDLISHMPVHLSGQRKKFYMATDRAALTRLAKAAGAADPADGSKMTGEQKQQVLERCAEPDHIGNEHLRAMILHQTEYGCRSEIAQYAITAFFDLMLNGAKDVSNRRKGGLRDGGGWGGWNAWFWLLSVPVSKPPTRAVR